MIIIDLDEKITIPENHLKILEKEKSAKPLRTLVTPSPTSLKRRRLFYEISQYTMHRKKKIDVKEREELLKKWFLYKNYHCAYHIFRLR